MALITTRVTADKVKCYSEPGKRRREAFIPRVPAVSERIALAIDLVVRYDAHSV